jgi:glycosyltransferase involved in cell wall biosynthesis
MMNPSPPHIVHVTERLSGGTLHFLVHVVQSLHEAGVKQTLLFGRGPDSPQDLPQLFPNTVVQHELPPARGMHWGFASRLARTLRQVSREHRADAVHLHSTTAGLLGRIILARAGLGAHCYYSPHGLPQLRQPRRWASRLHTGVERLVSRVLPFQPVGGGRSEAQLLEDISQRPAFLLQAPVADEFFCVQRRPDAAKPPVVLGAGFATDNDPTRRFAELALQAEINELGLRFVWAGGGDDRGLALLRGAAVEVSGWLSPEARCVQLGAASAFVHVAMDDDMPLLQALAAGLPCLAWDSPHHRDIVTPGRTGLLARDRDDLLQQLAELMGHAELRESLGRAGQDDARVRFGRDRFTHSLRALYGL